MVVACGVEAVELLEGLPARSEAGVGVEQLPEAVPVGVGEGVASAQQREAGPEHVGLEDRFDPWRLAALDVAAHRGEPGCEPPDDVESVKHVAGVAQVGVDRGLVGPRAVCDHDLDAPAPAAALRDEEPRERRRAAVRHHGQRLAGVGVDDHGDVAVTAPHRGLIDQQHPARSASAVLGHQIRPAAHQRHHRVPPQLVASGRRGDGHHLDIGHQPARQPRGEAPLEGVMVLQEPAAAVAAAHAPPLPHQSRATPRHLEVADLLAAAVMDPAAAEPAVRAPQPPGRRLHAHHQARRGVLNHPQHTNLRQMKPHRHNIPGHRGPPGSLTLTSPIPAGPRPLLRDPQPPPSPQIREGSTNDCCAAHSDRVSMEHIQRIDATYHFQAKPLQVPLTDHQGLILP